jgi:hypothetical protein
MSHLCVNLEAGQASETLCIIHTREWMIRKQNTRIPEVLLTCSHRSLGPHSECIRQFPGQLVVIEVCWYKCWIMNVMLHSKSVALFACIVSMYFFFLLVEMYDQEY